MRLCKALADEKNEHRSKGCLMRSRAIDVPEVAEHTRLETTRRYLALDCPDRESAMEGFHVES